MSPKQIIGYFNSNSYPVSFTGPQNAPITLPEGEPLLNGGVLVQPNRLCDHLVNEGILRAIIDGDKRFSRFTPSKAKAKVSASASLLTADDANSMPASQVPVTRTQAPSSKMVPQTMVDSHGVQVTLPSGATVAPDGKISYNSMTFANEVAFKAFLKSVAGTDDGSR